MLERGQLGPPRQTTPLAPWQAIERVTPRDEAAGAPASTNLVTTGGGGGEGGADELTVTMRVGAADRQSSRTLADGAA